MGMRLLVAVFIAAIAALCTVPFDRHSFEERSARAELDMQARAKGSKCPLSQDEIRDGDMVALAICEHFGLIAYDAAKRYPSASKVFAVYGEDPEFGEVLDRYGHQVVPIVAYFAEHGSTEYEIRRWLTVQWQKFKGENAEIPVITPEQAALIGIGEIKRRGNEMLAEFEIVDALARRKQGTRILFETKDFFLGGITDLEKILVRGEHLPTWEGIGNAALDVTIIAGGAGAVLKVVRAGARTEEKISVIERFGSAGRG